MGYTHTNSKGQTYGLHRKVTDLGDGRSRTLYYFSRETAGAIDALPAGYTVVEAKTGLPLLRKG
jgi:hypothetical protein